MKIGLPVAMAAMGLACSTGAGQPAAAPAPVETVSMHVVKRDVAAGQVLSASDLGVVQTPRAYQLDTHVVEPVEGMRTTTALYRCFDTPASVVGQVVKERILANEPVRAERLQ